MQITPTRPSVKVIGRSFYERNTLVVAPDILGKLLVRRLRGKELAGRIMEVEAYRGSDDPASHAFHGITKRNDVMFGPPGHAYVYFTYGNHFCLNIKTEPENVPAAILIRAVEPVVGLDAMLANRGKKVDVHQIANGPGKLTKAFVINRRLNGADMTRPGVLFVSGGDAPGNFKVATSPRIGIKVATERHWRFFIEENKFVSRRSWPRSSSP